MEKETIIIGEKCFLITEFRADIEYGSTVEILDDRGRFFVCQLESEETMLLAKTFFAKITDENKAKVERYRELTKQIERLRIEKHNIDMSFESKQPSKDIE